MIVTIGEMTDGDYLMWRLYVENLKPNYGVKYE